MGRKTPPRQFSAYLVISSDEPSMPVGATLIDKGSRIYADWNVMDFTTGKETGAVGRRMSRLCRECRLDHKRVGILGHEGECGSEDVVAEARQELADAQKRIETQEASPR